MIPSPALEHLSDKSRKCIQRLEHYELKEKPDLFVLSSFPRLASLTNRKNLCNSYARSSQSVSKLAAVLVLLYECAGELRVLLTTRSKTLRSHPGQTAL